MYLAPEVPGNPIYISWIGAGRIAKISRREPRVKPLRSMRRWMPSAAMRDAIDVEVEVRHIGEAHAAPFNLLPVDRSVGGAYGVAVHIEGRLVVEPKD